MPFIHWLKSAEHARVYRAIFLAYFAGIALNLARLAFPHKHQSYGLWLSQIQLAGLAIFAFATLAYAYWHYRSPADMSPRE